MSASKAGTGSASGLEAASTGSFEAVKARLEEIAELVQDESLPLDDALDLYEEAVKLGLRASDLLEVGIVVNDEADEAGEAGGSAAAGQSDGSAAADDANGSGKAAEGQGGAGPHAGAPSVAEADAAGPAPRAVSGTD